MTEELRIGALTVRPFVSSRFALDGGSMFGVVPRVLWEKKAPADELNRIALNVNSVLVESGGMKILIEPGMGSRYDGRRRELYALEEGDAVSGLRAMGVGREEIDVVVLTHLHLDHAGGSTEWPSREGTPGRRGKPRPAFPRARYVVQRAERGAAERPHPVARGSYSPADFVPLESEGRLELVSGASEVAPGVRVEPTGGHTPGHQVVRLASGGEEGLYAGDIVPTLAHLRLHWLMSWDLDPLTVYGEKKRLLIDAAARGTVLFVTHDPVYAACRIERGADASFSPIEGTLVEASFRGKSTQNR